MGRRTASSSSTISTRSPASDPAGACALAPPPEADSAEGFEGARAGAEAGAGAGAVGVAESGAEAGASGSDRTKRAPKPGGDVSVRSPPASRAIWREI